MNFTLPIIFVAWIILVCILRSKKLRESNRLESKKAASESWSRVLVERNQWLKEHPFAQPSHPEHQRLLRQELGAYMLWLEIHAETLDDELEYVEHATKLKEMSNAIDEKISLV